jgi:hypothetical protein
MNFSRHHLCCFTVVPLFLLDKSMVKNKCLQHPCFKNLCKIAQASKNSDSNAQHFLSDLLTQLWFHSMLFALPGYQFPYTVMNRCLYLSSHCVTIFHFWVLKKVAWFFFPSALVPWNLLDSRSLHITLGVATQIHSGRVVWWFTYTVPHEDLGFAKSSELSKFSYLCLNAGHRSQISVTW